MPIETQCQIRVKKTDANFDKHKLHVCHLFSLKIDEKYDFLFDWQDF